MNTENNQCVVALKTVITSLAGKIKPEQWNSISLLLVDAMDEIRRLEKENEELRRNR